MIFVFPYCPVCENKISQIDDISRLFPYPHEPTRQGKITILNSGAWGLAYGGIKMTKPYMKKLSDFYKEFDNENTFCVAPDEWLNPSQSMYNFHLWNKLGLYENIVPVLQSEQKNLFDLDNLKKQADYYRGKSKYVFIGNNNLTPEVARNLRFQSLLDYLHNIGYEYVHLLGAGWNDDEIVGWSTFDYLNSVDSIAYYKEKTEDEILKRIEEIRCLNL